MGSMIAVLLWPLLCKPDNLTLKLYQKNKIATLMKDSIFQADSKLKVYH